MKRKERDRIRRTARWTTVWSAFSLAAWMGTMGCEPTGSPSAADVPEHRVEVAVSSERGLEEAVRIDSVQWWLFLFVPEGMEEKGELEGRFTARFANLSDSPLQVRYDLRFYDQEGFLVDAFIPLGQPVRLKPRQERKVEGEFLLRADDPRDLERIALMRLSARVAEPD